VNSHDIDPKKWKGLLKRKIESIPKDREMPTENHDKLSEEEKEKWARYEFNLIFEARRMAEDEIKKELNSMGIFCEGLDAYQGFYSELVKDTRREFNEMKKKYWPELFEVVEE